MSSYKLHQVLVKLRTVWLVKEKLHQMHKLKKRNRPLAVCMIQVSATCVRCALMTICVRILLEGLVFLSPKPLPLKKKHCFSLLPKGYTVAGSWLFQGQKVYFFFSTASFFLLIVITQICHSWKLLLFTPCCLRHLNLLLRQFHYL